MISEIQTADMSSLQIIPVENRIFLRYANNNKNMCSCNCEMIRSESHGQGKKPCHYAG